MTNASFAQHLMHRLTFSVYPFEYSVQMELYIWMSFFPHKNILFFAHIEPISPNLPDILNLYQIHPTIYKIVSKT